MVGIKKIGLFFIFAMSTSTVLNSSVIQEKKDDTLQQHPTLLKKVMHKITRGVDVEDIKLILVVALIVYGTVNPIIDLIVKIKSSLRSVPQPKLSGKISFKNFDKKERQQIVQDICRMYPLPNVAPNQCIPGHTSISPQKVGALLNCYYREIVEQYGKKGARKVLEAQEEHLDLQFAKAGFTYEDVKDVVDLLDIL